MTSVLITFLGRTPKGENGYRTTCYDFGEGEPGPPVAFFGWALRERLRPDRMVILGTRGSMWDHLFEGDLDLGSEAEEKRLTLVEAVEAQQVPQSLLDDLAPLLSQRLGCEVRLRLIPRCRDAAEQVELLGILAEEVAQGDTVELDVTHGFRHLPMLGLLSALHLRRVKDARIAHIWYGAFDPDTRQAPVMELGGLLEIADWLEALSAYDTSGNYGLFAPLVDEAIGSRLEEASFLESVGRIGQARSRLRTVLDRLDELPATPAWELFRPDLERRIAWARGDNYYLRQRELALEFLRHGQYRDAILGTWEAFTTLLMREQNSAQDPDNAANRDQARETFDREQRQITPRTGRYRAYDTLRRLRNAVAHGSQPRGEEVQRALANRQAMHALLVELTHTLLPEHPDA